MHFKTVAAGLMVAILLASPIYRANAQTIAAPSVPLAPSVNPPDLSAPDLSGDQTVRDSVERLRKAKEQHEKVVTVSPDAAATQPPTSPTVTIVAPPPPPDPGLTFGFVPTDNIKGPGAQRADTAPPQPAVSAATTAALPPPPVQAPPVPSFGQASATPGCNMNGDLTQMLSPGCLDALRALRAPSGQQTQTAPSATPSNFPFPQNTVQCAVVIFTPTQSLAPPAFSVPSMEKCFAAGAQMSYGMPSITNVTAIDPNYGAVAISCRRPAPAGEPIDCRGQQQ